jgi:hypothetical protein
MKRELALRLLQTTMPNLGDEAAAANLFRELEFLADYKYNKYEMYHPGRLFLENLYLWLQQFAEAERQTALDFVRRDLIFVSRQEFQQLAGVLYHDVIRQRQMRIAGLLAGLRPFRVRAIRESPHFRNVTRASLYVGLSDGARIDYLRRHNLDISNEQVIPHYETSAEKVRDVLRELRVALGDGGASFRCLLLLDDFCGSGRTLLREVVVEPLDPEADPPVIPQAWRARFRFDPDKRELELLYEGEVASPDLEALLRMGSGDAYVASIRALVAKARSADTRLKGALAKVATGALSDALHPSCSVFFCPLLATEQAVERLRPLLTRLPGAFSRTEILPAAVMDSRIRVSSATTAMGELCDKYYSEDFGDEHTGSVKFGFADCGLPVVLHHNTPNNSLYILWARRVESFNPLFVRYERHGREGA